MKHVKEMTLIHQKMTFIRFFSGKAEYANIPCQAVIYNLISLIKNQVLNNNPNLTPFFPLDGAGNLIPKWISLLKT